MHLATYFDMLERTDAIINMDLKRIILIYRLTQSVILVVIKNYKHIYDTVGLCNVVVVVGQNAKYYALQDLKLKGQLYITKEIYFTEVFLYY
jgi:hypothetical protein